MSPLGEGPAQCDEDKFRTKSRQYRHALRRHLSFWQQITTDRTVLSIIKEGLRFPNDCWSQHWYRACRCPPAAKESLSQTLSDRLESRVIKPTKPSKIVNLFFPVLQKGKFRWCLDCSVLNSMIVGAGVRYEGIERVRQSLNKDDWACSVDVKGAYLHVDIHPKSRYWLRFKADGQLYEFKRCPLECPQPPRLGSEFSTS